MANNIADISIKVIANANGVGPGLDKAEKELLKFDEMARQIGREGSGVSLISSAAGKAGVAMAAAFGTQQVMQGITNTIDRLDDIGDMAQGLGDTAENISRLHFAAEQLGSSAEAVDSAVAKMTKTIGGAGREGGAAQKAIESLGLDVRAISEMSPSQAFIAITNALGKLPTVYDRASVASKIFGKGAMEIISILKAGEGEIEKFGEQLDAIGGTVTTDQVEVASKLKDQMVELTASAKGFGAELLFITGPALSTGFKGLSNVLSGWRFLFQSLKATISVVGGKSVLDAFGMEPKQIEKANETLDKALESIAEQEEKTKQMDALTQKVLGEIKTAEQIFDEKNDAIYELFLAGRINQEEYNTAVNGYLRDMDKAIEVREEMMETMRGLTKAENDLIEEEANALRRISPSGVNDLREKSKEIGTGISRTKIMREGKALQSINDMIEEISDGWKSFGKSVTEEMKTPWERFLDRVDKLNNAFKFGSISAETYQRALDAANREMYGGDEAGIDYGMSEAESAFWDYNTPRGGWVGGSIPDNFRAFTTPEQSAVMGGRQSYAINQAAQGGGVSNESAELMTANQYLNQIARNTANMGMVA